MRTTTALCMAVLVAFGMLACFATPASAQIEGAFVYLYDGDLTDSSGNGNTGVPVDSSGVAPATPSYSTNLPAITGGNYSANRSLTLDQNTFINVPQSPSTSTLTGSFTFETWLNTASTPNVAQVDTFVHKANLPSVNPHPYWGMIIDQQVPFGGLVFRAQLDDGPNSLNIRGSTVLSQNQWHHLAMVVDRSPGMDEVRLYVDGQQETLIPGSDNNSIAGWGDLDGPNHVLTLGAHNQIRDPTPGFMDESRLILRVLSDAEIAQSATMSLIPEPSTLSLLALGSGLALLMRRRRRA